LIVSQTEQVVEVIILLLTACCILDLKKLLTKRFPAASYEITLFDVMANTARGIGAAAFTATPAAAAAAPPCSGLLHKRGIGVLSVLVTRRYERVFQRFVYGIDCKKNLLLSRLFWEFESMELGSLHSSRRASGGYSRRASGGCSRCFIAAPSAAALGAKPSHHHMETAVVDFSRILKLLAQRIRRRRVKELHCVLLPIWVGLLEPLYKPLHDDLVWLIMTIQNHLFRHVCSVHTSLGGILLLQKPYGARIFLTGLGTDLIHGVCNRCFA